MNWQKAAIEDLRKYNAQRESLENIRLRTAALVEEQHAIKCSLSDSTPVQGGGNRIEDKMLDNIVTRQRLAHTYRATQMHVKLVERGLEGLDERQRLVLERFYINSSRGSVERLMEELNYEKSRIYQLKDAALYQFTVSMYGLIDY